MDDSTEGAGAPPVCVPPKSDGRLTMHHFSTDAIAAGDRHGAWAARGFPSISALFESIPMGPFTTTASWIHVDGMVLQYATGTARLLDRTAARVADDGIAMLGVGIQLDGGLRGEASGTPFRTESGDALFLDMLSPSRVELPAGRSIQLGIPRHRAEQELGSPARLHGVTIPAARAALITGHLLQLRDLLPGLERVQQARVARTIMDVLALLVGDANPVPASGDGNGDEPLASIARRMIEQSLGAHDLGTAALTARLGVSRAALYREFEAAGGIQTYIRRRRLEMVRAALLDPDNHGRIGDLAYRWGFSDAAHLSRLFRSAYGTSPKAFREAAIAGRSGR